MPEEMIFRFFNFPSMSLPFYGTGLIYKSQPVKTQPVYNDIALYRLFGWDYRRFGPLSLYLLKFQRVLVRLLKRPSIEFFYSNFNQIFIIL